MPWTEPIRALELNEVLTLIAAQVGASSQELINYAAEDHIGGYHVLMTQRAWPMGSMWGVEGQILYALTRWLKPLLIVEIGGWAGCSATHFATAVERNGFGHVVSVDNGVGGQEHGYLIPDNLRRYVDLVNMDGRDFLRDIEPGKIGLLFEDADHSSELVAQLTMLGAQKMAAGGILANHDAGHDSAWVGDPPYEIGSNVGQEVVRGLDISGVFYKRYLAKPSDCGIAITKMPGEFIATQKSGSKPPYNQLGIAPIETTASSVFVPTAVTYAEPLADETGEPDLPTEFLDESTSAPEPETPKRTGRGKGRTAK